MEKASSWTLVASPADTDVIPLVTDIGGTPDNKAIKWSDLVAAVGGGGGGGGFELIQIATPSAVATLDFTLPAGFTSYQLRGHLLPVTDGANLWLRCDDGGGFDDTAEYANAEAASDSAGSYGDEGGTADGQIQVHRAASGVGSATNEGLSFTIDIERAKDAHYTYFISVVSAWADTGNYLRMHAGGAHNVASSLDAIRLLFSSGNIASGSVALLGVPDTVPAALHPTLIGSASPSAATSVDIDLTDGYEFFELFVDIVPSVDALFWLRMDDGGGFDSGTEYEGMGDEREEDGSIDNEDEQNAGEIQLHIFTAGGDGATEGVSAKVTISGAKQAARHTTVHGTYWKFRGDGSRAIGRIGGRHKVTSTIDAIRILTSTGTFTGEIRVYGIP